MIAIYSLFVIFSLTLGNFLILNTWEEQMFFLAGCLATHNITENYLLYLKRKTNPHFFINPIVITSITTMLLSLGGFTVFLMKYGNSIYFFNETTLFESEPQWLSKAMGINCMASAFMWYGYKLNFGEKFFKWSYNQLNFKKILNRKISQSKLLFVFGLGYAINFYEFSVGRFGYQVLIQGNDYEADRLKSFEGLTKLTFIIVYFLHKQNKNKPIWANLFYISFVLELIFSIIGGQRSGLVYFILSIFLVNQYYSEKIKTSFVVLSIASLIFAFTIGNSIKEFVRIGGTLGNVDPITAIKLYYAKKDNLDYGNIYKSKDDQWYEALGSSNFVSETAMAIRYKDQTGLEPDDPQFLLSLLTSPFYAIIPKFFILGERETSWGKWFNIKVLNAPITSSSSSAMSPVGFLYFAGNTIGVALGFFVYGIILKANYTLLSVKTVGGFIFFILTLSVTHTFVSDVSVLYIIFVRYWVYFPLIFLIFFSKNK